MNIRSFSLGFVLCGFALSSYAAQVVLTNGDQVTGAIVSETQEMLLIEAELLGQVAVPRVSVKDIIGDEPAVQIETPRESSVAWKREASLGYDRTSGNTNKESFSTRLYLNRKTDGSEFSIKGQTQYASTEKEMDTQDWYGMLRYAYSFGKKKKWYNFSMFEADHDRFANVDYRLLPSSGLGYWFFDSDDFKALAEASLGFEHTHFRDETKASNEGVLIGRTFLEKKIFKDTTLSEDLSVYPVLDDPSDYRLHSETALVNPLSDVWALRVSFINDYDFTPPPNTKRHDKKIITALQYSF